MRAGMFASRRRGRGGTGRHRHDARRAGRLEEAGHPLVADLWHSARLWAYAECAHAVGDQDAARLLYDELLQYDGQLLLWAWCFVPASAAFSLGRLAEALSDHDRALAHYTEALTFEESCGAETLAARTRQSLTRVG